MNKNHSECKKHLIRNTSLLFPKYVRVQKKIRESEPSEFEEKTEISDITLEAPDISEPKKNYSKCVEAKIKSIESLQPRRVKSLSDIPKSERNTYNEKITKHVNFPFDKKLYRKLISLQLVEKQVLQTVSVNYEPTVRDKVPKLEDFYVPRLKPEYTIPVSSSLTPHQITKTYDGLRLHKVMTTWGNN